jgi:hypothetical protein
MNRLLKLEKQKKALPYRRRKRKRSKGITTQIVLKKRLPKGWPLNKAGTGKYLSFIKLK